MEQFTEQEIEKAIDLSNGMQEIFRTNKTFSADCGNKLLEICDLLKDETLKNEIQNGNFFFPAFVQEETIEKVMKELCTHISTKDLEYVNEYTKGFLYQYYDEDRKKEVFPSIAEMFIEQLEDKDIMERYDVSYRISNLYKYSTEEIQKDNIEALLHFMEIYIERQNSSRSEELLKNVSPNVQRKIFLELFNEITGKLKQEEDKITKIKNGAKTLKTSLELLEIADTISGFERLLTIFMDKYR